MLDKMNVPQKLGIFLYISRPFFILGVAIIYALGAGIAHYLGDTLNWTAYTLGQIWITLLQLSAHYFHAYYNTPLGSEIRKTISQAETGSLNKPVGLSRRTALIAALICLGLLAYFSFFMVLRLTLSPVVLFLMVTAFIATFFYSSPPIKLEDTGYGELLASILVGFLTPAFSYILQTGKLHHLVAMCAFPIAALHMAMCLTYNLQDYLIHLQSGRRTLMLRIGWQNGMVLHNVLVLSAFLLISLARFFGLPQFAMVAGLLPLPIGLFQILQMRAIANGAKPNWRALTTTAAASFGLMAYLLTFTFWIN